VLGVSTSGYYRWRSSERLDREARDADLVHKIKKVHLRSRGTYGSPRVHADLVAEGDRVSKKRVARLMRAAGIRGVSRRKFQTTTRRPEDRPAPDLVQRDFTARGPNQLWVADITYVATTAGFLFLAVVVDVWSRRVVGWAMESHLRTELVLGALEMAISRRRPGRGLVHHSDQGTQYTSLAFGNRCVRAGISRSMGSVGDAYDNALCESFFATLETELLDRERFADRTVARAAIFEYVEGWYNPHRRHSALGYLSPIEFERLHGDLADPSLTPQQSTMAAA
jgi:putative transposase